MYLELSGNYCSCCIWKLLQKNELQIFQRNRFAKLPVGEITARKSPIKVVHHAVFMLCQKVTVKYRQPITTVKTVAICVVLAAGSKSSGLNTNYEITIWKITTTKSSEKIIVPHTVHDIENSYKI
jgi:hypothetical protein